jgi:hypothetical protein
MVGYSVLHELSRALLRDGVLPIAQSLGGSQEPVHGAGPIVEVCCLEHLNPKDSKEESATAPSILPTIAIMHVVSRYPVLGFGFGSHHRDQALRGCLHLSF